VLSHESSLSEEISVRSTGHGGLIIFEDRSLNDVETLLDEGISVHCTSRLPKYKGRFRSDSKSSNLGEEYFLHSFRYRDCPRSDRKMQLGKDISARCAGNLWEYTYPPLNDIITPLLGGNISVNGMNCCAE